MSEKNRLNRKKVLRCIDARTKPPKKVGRCARWTGKTDSRGRPSLKLKNKKGDVIRVDVMRAIIERMLGRELELEERIDQLTEKCERPDCVTPDHFHVSKVEKKQRFAGDEERISAFKQAVKDGARVGAIREEYGLSRSWAYQIATGKRYAEITPKGAVLNRVKQTLTPEQVALARRLRKKDKTRWTYSAIAKKLKTHYSTARDACVLDRESWKQATT